MNAGTGSGNVPRDRFEALAADFLEGELDAAAEAELEGILLADPSKAHALAELYRQGRAIAEVWKPLSNETFARRVRAEIDRDRGPFVSVVMAGVKAGVKVGVPGARLGRGWGFGTFGLAAAAVIGLVVGGLWLRGGHGAAIAQVATLAGNATLVHEGKQRLARVGDSLGLDDSLRTHDGAHAVIRYRNEETRLELEAATEVALGDGRNGKRVDLRGGEIQAEVAPQPAGRPMVLASAQATAEVLGTRLKLSAVPDGTRLEVTSGRVRLVRQRDGASVEVTAGHYALVDRDEPLVSEKLEADPGIKPAIVAFGLIAADGRRDPVPGFERLTDGAVIDLARLPDRRVSLQVLTNPERVGSVRMELEGAPPANMEMIGSYTLQPGNGSRVWPSQAGVFKVKATPYSGSYGNGVRGDTASITLVVVDGETRR